jgi:hypothetical protein
MTKDQNGSDKKDNKCGNCLNPSTIKKNIIGLTYPGGNNPTDFNDNANYSYKPENPAEYPAIGHDRRYDKLNIEGASGLILNKRAIGADMQFVAEELNIVFNSKANVKDKLIAGSLGLGLGALALPKTTIALSNTQGIVEVIYNSMLSFVGMNLNKTDKHIHNEKK